MLELATNPFLAQAFRISPDEVLEEHHVPEDVHALLKDGDLTAIQRALAGQVSAIANPWLAEQVPAAGIGVLLWPEFLGEAECRALRGELAGAGDGETEISERAVLDIVAQIGGVAPTIAAHFNVFVTDYERPHFLRHGPGSSSEPTCDNTGDPRQPSHVARRRLTVAVFVDGDGHRGGHLRLFRDGPDTPSWALPGELGLLVAFRATAWHRVGALASFCGPAGAE